MTGAEGPAGSTNIGALATRGGTVNAGNAIGQQIRASAAPGRQSAFPRADVGILTVLTEELRAVVNVLRRQPGYRTDSLRDGTQVHRAEVPGDGGPVRVAATQTLEPGPQSAAAAYRRLQDNVDPTTILLVGIAGGIRPDLQVGDVVIADEVIYYDARRETAEGARRRGKSHPTSPVLRHRVNDFFLRFGPTIDVGGGPVRVLRGPVGSGAAVMADANSDIRAYLRAFNEKTLAVETEAIGVGQAFYERIDAERSLTGWLTIRGISDLADRSKGHGDHQLASDHAAAVMERLIPLLGLHGDDR